MNLTLRSGITIRYDVEIASTKYNENRHPRAVLAELGISFTKSEGFIMGGFNEYYDCKGLPEKDKLPEFITIIHKVDRL